MNLCKNCRHWGKPALCYRDKRECSLINEKAVPSVMEVGLVVLESGDYASSDAQLLTDENFGCVLWEPYDSNR